MALGNLLGLDDLLDNIGDVVGGVLDPVLPGNGQGLDDVLDTITDLLGGTDGVLGEGELPLLGNLFNNGLLGGDLVGGILGIGLLEDGLLTLDIGGTDITILPDNGGLILVDGDGQLLGGGLLDLGGLLGGTGGLLDLSGLLTGILDLNGILGSVLDLLSPDGSLDPDDYLDDDGNVDPDLFEVVEIGTDGRDTFTINQSASTFIDGRGDIDVVNFARSTEGMSFAVGADAAVFSDGENIFYFQNVERVSFFEGSIYLDTDTGENAGVAYRLYQAAFDRAPDNSGVKFWVEQLDNGMNFKELATAFAISNEFQMRYGDVSNDELVNILYNNVLDRDADATGYAYWLDAIDSGHIDRYDLLLAFSESDENVALVGQTIGDGYTVV